MKKTRRDFLKIAGLSAFALGSAAAMGPAGALAASGGEGRYITSPKELKSKRWVMVIDTRRFTAPQDFQTVIDACHSEHNVPSIPGDQEIKWIWTDTFPHAFPDEAHQYLPDRVINGNFLLLCNQCENPPCVRVCPTGATFRNEANGIVVMDPHRCIGCRFCMAGCPYGSRSFNFQDPQPHIKNINPAYPARTRGVVEKCTFCPERLAAGKLPACVEASKGAILFGDLNDPNSSVRKALASNLTIQRKASLGTGPSVYYII